MDWQEKEDRSYRQAPLYRGSLPSQSKQEWLWIQVVDDDGQTDRDGPLNGRVERFEIPLLPVSEHTCLLYHNGGIALSEQTRRQYKELYGKPCALGKVVPAPAE